MTNEITKTNSVQTLQERLDSSFLPVKQTIESLKVEHEEIMALELTDENCAKAKMLSKKYQKLRSATDAIHKSEKAFYLEGGRAVDEFKRETYKVIEPLETQASERAEYFILKAKKAKEELNAKRTAEVNKYEPVIFADYSDMADEIFATYLEGLKREFELKKENERKAIEAEAERIRIEKEEQARIKAENEKLRKESEERDAKERAEREKIQKENDEKLRIERAEREKKEQELKAIQEAEKTRIRLEKEAAEKLEQEKIAKEKALSEGSDKEKWNAFVSELEKVTAPKFETDLYKAYLENLCDFFIKTVK